MSQDWRGARVTSGSGGAGGRGGDIGSHNRYDTSSRKSNNHVNGDNYNGSVDKGDSFSGPISNSAVGGRGNSNQIHNNGSPGQADQKISAREMDINEQLNRARERLAAKKEKARLKKLEDELKRLEAEAAEFEDD